MKPAASALPADVTDAADAVAAATAVRAFEAVFGCAPDAVGSAPGRVNLLGEHTDYNDGYVLPIAIAQQTTVAMRRCGPAQADAGVTLHAASLGCSVQFSWQQLPSDHFATYVYGCLRQAASAGVATTPLQIHVDSQVPMGVGLSSSAALEVATLHALRTLSGAAFDDVRIAEMAQQAEIIDAGVRCGIMDQMAASLADTRHARWLDTRSLERRWVELPRDSALLVLDSGMARSLAASGYNARRGECEQAARLLGVASLRDVDVDDAGAINALPDPLRRRVRHVLTENARVLQALQAVDASAFGQLMNASHASLRDDYEVSLPDLDRLMALLQAHAQVYGARHTGAGFGGACVALCRPEAVHAVAHQVLGAYAAGGSARGAQLVPAAA